MGAFLCALFLWLSYFFEPFYCMVRQIACLYRWRVLESFFASAYDYYRLTAIISAAHYKVSYRFS